MIKLLVQRFLVIALYFLKKIAKQEHLLQTYDQKGTNLTKKKKKNLVTENFNGNSKCIMLKNQYLVSWVIQKIDLFRFARGLGNKLVFRFVCII